MATECNKIENAIATHQTWVESWEDAIATVFFNRNADLAMTGKREDAVSSFFRSDGSDIGIVSILERENYLKL